MRIIGKSQRAGDRGDLLEGVELSCSDTIVTDDLDQSLGTGHFCEMKVDKLGKISGLTYFHVGDPITS